VLLTLANREGKRKPIGSRDAATNHENVNRPMLDTDTCSYIMKRSHPPRSAPTTVHRRARGNAGPTLDTNNTTEFERVNGPKIENWTIQSRRRGLLNFYERAA
jgi:hypothetical protein